MPLKRRREIEETEVTGRVPKLAKFDHDGFQKAFIGALKGNPELRVEGARHSNHYDKSNVSTITSEDNISTHRTNTGSFLNIRLFNRSRDFPTTFLKEVQAPRSPCGGLNINSLSILFDVKGKFEVIDNKAYKPVLIQNHILVRDVVDLLLRDSSYIRVICKI